MNLNISEVVCIELTWIISIPPKGMTKCPFHQREIYQQYSVVML
jgi:hypothetical protein